MPNVPYHMSEGDPAARAAHKALLRRKAEWNAKAQPLVECMLIATLIRDIETFRALEAEFKALGPEPGREA